MKPTEAMQEALYKELLSHIKETDRTVPYRYGDYFYYSRTEQGKQYPIHCRKKGSLDTPEQVILDVNELAKGEKLMGIGSLEVSDDGLGLPAQPRPGLGLTSMRERAEELGGACGAETRPEGGARVWASLPLPPASSHG